jgi:Transposase DDE domain
MTELEDWDVLLSLFPAGWRELGRSSGAVQRLRGFSSVDAVLRILLLHVGCGLSLRETAVQARLAGVAAVSDVALLKRLRDAEPWLLEMCRQLWKENGVDLEAGALGRPVRLLDATVVREPGQTGSQWRLHYSLRLPDLQCDHFELTSMRGIGVGEQFGRFHFEPGELVLADAGYCHAAGIAAVVQAQAAVCVRLNPRGLSLRDQHGEPFVPLDHLAALTKAGDLGDWPVQIFHKGLAIAGRVCAIRKSPEAIRLAQRRLDRKRNKGQTIIAATRKYAEYVLVFTSLDAAEASAEQVLETYRLRWQIELAFRRLKSTLDLGHVPKYDDQSSRAWLYAKLLVALLGEKLSRLGKTFSPWGYLPPAPHPKPLA